MPTDPRVRRQATAAAQTPPRGEVSGVSGRKAFDKRTYATVALESGGVMSFPGHTAFPDGYDARQRPWYRAATTASSVLWGLPYEDSGSGELNLPCSAPIRSDGQLLGIASVKLSLGAVVGDLLADDHGHRALLDSDGRVLARHPTDSDFEPVRRTSNDIYEVQDGRLRVMQPIESRGWLLVVEGELDDMLHIDD